MAITAAITGRCKSFTSWKVLRTLSQSVLITAVACSTSAAQPQAGDNERAEVDYGRLIFSAELLPATGENASSNGAESSPASTSPATTSQSSDAAAGSTRAAASNEDPRRYEVAISEAIESAGPYSTGLREQYQSLGELYQARGEHDKAISTFQSAQHIDRVNDGLFTLQQIPLVENIIESYTALADFDELNNHHEYLYYIQKKSYPENDPRLWAAKEEWADWNVESYLKEGTVRNGVFDTGSLTNTTSMGANDQYVAVYNERTGAVAYVPRQQMGSILNPAGANTAAMTTDFYQRSMAYAVPPEQLIDARLRTAQDLYEELIANTDEQYNSARNSDVEHKLANIAYSIKQQLESFQKRIEENSLDFNRIGTNRPNIPLVTSGYTKNRETLEQLAVSLEQDTAADPRAVARAYINLGDWDLSYDRPQRSRENYEKALALLLAAGLAPVEVDSVFNPSPLIPVPGFALHPYSRAFFGLAADTALDYDGYMDVSMTINGVGSVRSPRIQAESAGTGQQLRSTLLDYLREQTMRPLAKNGTLARESEVTLRIYYYY